MHAIQTTALTKVFRGHRALDGLNMNVARGDIYGFIGKNGSGKSTTMKIAAGLMPASGGEVRVMGRVLGPCEAHPQVSSLIEEPGIYANLSPMGNMMVKALALGLVNPRPACRQLLETVGLAEAPKRSKRMSLGMKQRLGIALALLGSPDVLMLDEPLNGLDPEAARDIRNLLARLNRERGVTVLISSHVLDQLERVCTRYGVIRDGRMVAELTSDEVDAACASCLMLKTTEPPRTVALLADRMPQLPVTALPDGSLRLDGAVDAVRVGELLRDEGIVVTDLHRMEGDREAFFVNLMGGHDDEGVGEGRDDAGRSGSDRGGSNRGGSGRGGLNRGGSGRSGGMRFSGGRGAEGGADRDSGSARSGSRLGAHRDGHGVAATSRDGKAR